MEERKNIKELDLRNLNLEGDLDLAGFPSHLKVYLAGNPHLGKIKNKTHWTKLIYQNPQEFLDYLSYNKNQLEKIDLEGLDFDKSSKFELILDNYPQLKEIDGNFIDSSIIKITISNCSQLEEVCVGYSKSLKTLNLNNLPNLKKLDCRENNLTILDLTNFTNLERLECFNNRLTEIKLPKGEKLEYLHLGRNNFNHDLSFLKDLVNLKELYLFGNKFTGSLKPLKDLNKLE